MPKCLKPSRAGMRRKKYRGDAMKKEAEKKQYGLSMMLLHTWKLGVRKCPWVSFLFFISMILTGVCTAANVFFKQNFFDAVQALVEGSGSQRAAFGCGIAMALFLLLTLAVQAAGELAETNFGLVLKGYLGKELNRKAARIDPIVYEDNRFLDHINKAYVGLEAIVEVVTAALMMGIKEVSYFVFMGCYFFSIKPQLLGMFIVSFFPTLLGSFIRRRMYANLENESAPYRRKYEYFEKCLCDREYVKETRLWRAGNFFLGLFRKNQDIYTQKQWKTEKHAELTELALRFLLLTGYVGTIILLFVYLFRGEIGVGAFAAIFASMDQLFDRMENVFNRQIGNITRSFGPAQNYFAFLNLKEREGRLEEPLKRESIELRQVSFAYPNSTKNALEDINLNIRQGETIAIVGVNGSGKSTLTRLLAGLYVPTEGQLLIDGKDVRDISHGVLYRGVSGVFQKYQCYKMTVEENVRLSEENSTEPVEQAIQKAAFPLESEKLTDGVRTMLGKDFGGIDLSGGQWQRLAIARGLYRTHDMILLDEPTAAIDPLEEAAIYRKFAEMSADKTAFIVTHRLGSAKIADRIIVMDGGRIVETGTHEELLERHGKYEELYQAQAKWYA